MQRGAESNASTAWGISVRAAHPPTEFARFCARQGFRSYKEITTTPLAMDSPIANAVIPIRAITISRSYLTTTLFGARAATTKPGCKDYRRRFESGSRNTASCFATDHLGK